MQDGELFITGRLKDLIIIRGLNHYPQDIEATAGNSHPRLRPGNGAAFTVEIGGTIGWSSSKRSTPSAARARWRVDAIRRDVAGEHELPVEAIALIKAGSIPKTSSGKIQRHACRQAFLSGELEIVEEWRAWTADAAVRIFEAASQASMAKAPRADITTANRASITSTHRRRTTAPHSRSVDEHRRHRARNEVRRMAKERAVGITLDSSIVELGLDSLERMEIIASLEDFTAAASPRTCCRRSKAAAKWRPPSRLISAKRRVAATVTKSFAKFHPKTIASSASPNI